ncbi:MAG TPA: acyl carrier protein [Ktedonobacterales bacterium]
MEPTATGLRGLNLIRQQVREFIMQNFFYGGLGQPLTDDLLLVERGGLDQTGVLEIAMFIEETYGVQVDEADLTPENFDTIDNIARFIYLHLANS